MRAWQESGFFYSAPLSPDMDIFLGLLRQLAEETQPGLGPQVNMCWIDTRHVYRVWVEEPYPILSP
ncbi:MAG: hypothetical protein H6714_01900 [Myxococcales bacterium]|nr:hypothetical protein [Myxococcales bacterium]